jgi:hypothetical protein
MDTAPTIVEPATLPAAFVEEMLLATHFAGAFRAEATLLAYESDWHVFAWFCAERGLEALPATEAALCTFLAHEAAKGRKASTLDRRCGAIKWKHKTAGLAVPTDSEATKAVMGGIKCAIGVAPVRKHSVMSETAIAMAAGSYSLRT